TPTSTLLPYTTLFRSRNCEEICPVGNEHVDKIIDLRRYLVLTEGDVAPEAQRTFQNIERQSNPWGINRNERIRWRDELDGIRVRSEEHTSELQSRENL